jgi:SAM-dependent methyltransferase
MIAEELYDTLYSTPDSKGGLYGFNMRRCPPFINYIFKNIPKESSVLEVGCGRGYLLRWLLTLGYKAEGTEISQYLMNNDLVGLPVRKISCYELSQMRNYDVVISNDVLEHLENEELVDNTVKEFGRIANKWILVSTGGTRAATSLCGSVHNVVKPKQWWIDLCNKYYGVKEVLEERGSLYIFGEK